MSIRRKKSASVRFLEKLAGGPLTFGRLLRAIRLGEDMSQTEFAKFLAISKAHLCDIEKGRRIVGTARAWAWAEKLGYPPEQFVELVLEAGLSKEGLKFRVKLEAA